MYKDFLILDYVQLTDVNGHRRPLTSEEKTSWAEQMRRIQAMPTPFIYWRPRITTSTIMAFPKLIEDVQFEEV